MSAVATHPSQPLRIMTSPLRAQTEPRTGRFLRSMMRHNDFDGLDGLDEGIMMMSEPEKKSTQEEQDAADDKARKGAMRNLVNSWQERLQLISVITTFFASTEAALLVNTKPDDRNSNDRILMATNACLLGALILHVYASVLSFLGAFLLIRYKLKEATREEMIAEGIKLVNSPSAQSTVHDVERGAPDPTRTLTRIDVRHPRRKSAEYDTAKLAAAPTKQSSFALEPPVISANPHIEQVGPFMSSVSSHLLSRTHALCVWLAAAGFVLAIAGILCYAWDSQPHAVSIFASACFGVAALAMGVLLL